LNENLILVAIFVAVLMLSFAILKSVARQREISRNLDAAGKRKAMSEEEINQFLGSGNEHIRYFLDVTQNDDVNSLRMRLVQAGFFRPTASMWFNLIRTVGAVVVFLSLQIGLPLLLPAVATILIFLFAVVCAGFFYILASAVLEMIGNRRVREFRKLFPDFMDLLLVCVDAGLSINAAIDRVTREFLLTTPNFGVHLSIINLEIRAGRPLHDALYNFSQRIRVEEARTLAVLFRQSEELGSSVSKTLRTFAREMRQMRIIRAEEKANALPVKMLFPMAFFMFPVSLVIVLVPILMAIVEMLVTLTPR